MFYLHVTICKNTIWAEFNDSDNKVDANDVKYQNGVHSEIITSFLMKHIGEAWDGLKSQVNQLIQTFNLEQDSKQK